MSRAAVRRSPQPVADTLYDEKPQEPRLYRVLLHNDDYTTMEFVVIILMEVFRKTGDEATAIMLAVHKCGQGQCGVYPLEIAEIKVAAVHRRAREANFPLRCTLEEA
ncbi:MAG: ATP-dependent Clp protease adaptor ClpS [Deltaproteobacteria bacterium]|jgi:ATP-dependent Clp protease adaptor protein ClpS|nr:ATP-dependent Clp protease adaptor ClpS [Deltaproteobacteria bacterium]